MSGEENDNDNNFMMLCCASCGVAEVESVKLKKCNGCHIVKYCSIACQRNHWPKHKRDCMKRAAELRDELLFKQPERSYLGDCPICCLPLQFDLTKSVMMMCCSKIICKGCHCANRLREIKASLVPSCPFCREATPEKHEEVDKQRMKRIEMNDPTAIFQEGGEQYSKGDFIRAFEYWTKAAQLGDVEAHYQLFCLCQFGRGVEQDRGKAMYHLEEAAIGGHPTARHLLGVNELRNDNFERARKHWIIAATQGHVKSMTALMEEFRNGVVSKEDLAAALRAHQAAVNATKSPQRETAEELYQNTVMK